MHTIEIHVVGIDTVCRRWSETMIKIPYAMKTLSWHPMLTLVLFTLAGKLRGAWHRGSRCEGTWVPLLVHPLLRARVTSHSCCHSSSNNNTSLPHHILSLLLLLVLSCASSSSSSGTTMNGAFPTTVTVATSTILAVLFSIHGKQLQWNGNNHSLAPLSPQLVVVISLFGTRHH